MTSVSAKEGITSGDLSPELVPVVEPGALALAFPTPAEAAFAGDLILGDILSDALFGEVIDISDLIPRLTSAGETVVPQPPVVESVAAVEFGLQDGSDLLASHAAALTILYDDDILASDSTIL